jgi:hypothetical protein
MSDQNKALTKPSSAIQSAPSQQSDDNAVDSHNGQVALWILSNEQLVCVKKAVQAGAARIVDLLKAYGGKFGPIGAVISGTAESFVALIDPPGRTTEECRCISAFNLSARAVARTVAQISEPELKQRVAQAVGPLLGAGVKGATNEDITELFYLSSIEELEEDLVSDAAKQETSEMASAGRNERVVHFCKGAVIRRNGRFTLFIAYFKRCVSLPKWSITALLESRKDVDRYLKTMKLLAQHELHQAMLREAPPGVLLQTATPQAAITNAIM